MPLSQKKTECIFKNPPTFREILIRASLFLAIPLRIIGLKDTQNNFLYFFLSLEFISQSVSYVTGLEPWQVSTTHSLWSLQAAEQLILCTAVTVLHPWN